MRNILIGVGFCGSFTTMSSFALVTSNLLDNSRFYLVALNILANVGLSLGAVIGGRAGHFSIGAVDGLISITTLTLSNCH